MVTRPGPVVGPTPQDDLLRKCMFEDTQPLLTEVLKIVRKLDDQVGLMITGQQAIKQEIFHLARSKDRDIGHQNMVATVTQQRSGQLGAVASMVKVSKMRAKDHRPMMSKVQSQNLSLHSDGLQPQSFFRNTSPQESQAGTEIMPLSQHGSHSCNELGQGWPSEIRVRKEFEKSKVSGEDNWQVVVARLSSGGLTSDDEDDEEAGPHGWETFASQGGAGIRGLYTDEGRSGRRMLDPDSSRAMIFDAIMCVVLMHDLFITPYSLVLGFRLLGGMRISYIVSMVCWTIDFLLGFVTGYYHEGELVCHRQRIRARYLRGWCLPNMVVLIFDYTALVFSYTGHHSFGRIFQLARLVKTLRVVRLVPIAARLGEVWSFGRGSWILLKIVSAVFALLLYNHFIACMWLFIGTQAQSNTGLRWIDIEEDRFQSEYSMCSQSDTSAFAQEHPIHFYLVSLHWALAQMTPGPIDINSSNLTEKMFNLAVLLVGIFVASFLVSLMSGQVMEMIISKRQKKELWEQLEAYMRQNGIRSKLHLRIKRQFQTRLHTAQMIQEDQVKALDLLSSSMRARLLCETRKPYLNEHPIFSILAKIDSRVLNKVCMDAVGFIYLEAEDELFEPLVPASGAYRVISGHFRYTQTPGVSKVVDIDVTEVPGTDNAHKWFCEPALWTLWVHVGQMEATTKAQVLCVAAEPMASALAGASDRSGLKQLVQEYASKYHMRLTMAVPPQAPWPTDLHVPDTEPGDLVPRHISIGLLNRAITSGAVNMEADTLMALRNELKAEKCMLQIGEDGQLCRLVTLITLRLMDEEGRVLIEVARTHATKDCWTASNCGMLPGSKREMGELPATALKRVLDGQLHQLTSHLTVDKVDHFRYTEESPRYGMRTIYAKTVHEASLHVGAPQLPRFHAPHLGPPPVPFAAACLQLQTAEPPEDRKITLYAWVHPHDLAAASHASTKEAVIAWLSALKATDLYESVSDLDDDDMSSFMDGLSDYGQISST